MDFGALPLSNPTATDAAQTTLLGFAKIFVPAGSAQGIILPHPRNPGESISKDEKTVSTAMYGQQRDLKKLVTKVTRERTFESLGSSDPQVRALHAGGAYFAAAIAGATVATFAVSTAYTVGQYVKPTGGSTDVYQVTTAGTSAGTAPTWGSTMGSTTTSGTAVFTKVNAPSAPTIILDNGEVAYGRVIDVYLNAEGADSLPGEIYVAPYVALQGDGYASGRDGANETALKFKETILDPQGYTLPSSVGSLGGRSVAGGFLIVNVPGSAIQAAVASLISGT